MTRFGCGIAMAITRVESLARPSDSIVCLAILYTLNYSYVIGSRLRKYVLVDIVVTGIVSFYFYIIREFDMMIIVAVLRLHRGFLII